MEMHLLTVLEAGRLRSKCLLGWPFGGLSPWRADGRLLPMSSRGLPSVRVCVPIFSSYKGAVSLN